MVEVNRITFCKDNYQSEQEWKDAIAAAVMLLLEAEYIMTVKYDEKGLGIVCIDFESDKLEWGGPFPYWLEPEDFEKLEYLKNEETINIRVFNKNTNEEVTNQDMFFIDAKNASVYRLDDCDCVTIDRNLYWTFDETEVKTNDTMG